VAKPFDAATKHLFESDPGTWLAYADLLPDGPLTVIDTDLSTVTAAADAVVRLDGPAPWIVITRLHSVESWEELLATP
jgi:hypothetical protein